MLAPTPNVILGPDAATFDRDALDTVTAAFHATGYTLALRERAIDDPVTRIDLPHPTRATVTVYRTGAVEEFTEATAPLLAECIAAFVYDEQHSTATRAVTRSRT
ncbi:hypothetical protein LO763_19480 [Glycomyces sp. A-F 0318]|uniref:hypothetical protein n=1 Tax=Glycomyces amatae TaxID=2881355 RepID=UPI001E3BAD6E|nr:hypothetical protein [Glycomyces amatae]MCD0445793.1 hypothetical protein [Glycomyces amatae]